MSDIYLTLFRPPHRAISHPESAHLGDALPQGGLRPDALGAALADAFAPRDVEAIAQLITPSCWFTSAVAKRGHGRPQPRQGHRWASSEVRAGNHADGRHLCE